MPSGKTHDAITFFLTAPIFAVSFVVTREIPVSVVVALGMLIGGLMFGPDLDTNSKQYSRWGWFKFMWYPYQAFFPHRSRWSHGLVFGTLFRVVYFMGAVTSGVFWGLYLFATYTGGDLPNLVGITETWQPIGEFVRSGIGPDAIPALFAGLWLGAASHTLTDMAGTFIRTGRIGEFL